jgi:NAD(P)-dependent dehydrogenase (short-subunit alcohol dehydrogenase family)
MLITAGGGDIGKAAMRCFLERGANLMLNVPMTAVLTTTRANAGEPMSSDSGTKKIAGSSPVGHPPYLKQTVGKPL